MKIVTGRVVHGKIELDTPLADGTSVAVLAADEAAFRLTAADEEELSKALSAIRQGEFEDGHTLLAELKGLSQR